MSVTKHNILVVQLFCDTEICVDVITFVRDRDELMINFAKNIFDVCALPAIV